MNIENEGSNSPYSSDFSEEFEDSDTESPVKYRFLTLTEKCQAYVGLLQI